jgi:hypothetical protein
MFARCRREERCGDCNRESNECAELRERTHPPDMSEPLGYRAHAGRELKAFPAALGASTRAGDQHEDEDEQRELGDASSTRILNLNVLPEELLARAQHNCTDCGKRERGHAANERSRERFEQRIGTDLHDVRARCHGCGENDSER